ncbi:MAG: GNAT family N-acetyltransferase [Planctomycetes bacterium]|nr:GNAT family N-acetyltransferase [Planctomycetota bacterium]
MSISIRPMSLEDYDEVLALWQAAEGVGLNEADERGPIAAYLRRNAGLSLVACNDRQIVGAVLCGHDGRRGYLHHLAIAPAFRRRGIGRKLVEQCLAGLGSQGILRCHIFLYVDNHGGSGFWRTLGWIERTELKILTKGIGETSLVPAICSDVAHRT